METIQLTAQVDERGILSVQMPDRLKNHLVEATIVFTTSNKNSNELVSWQELVTSLNGAWADDFPSLTEIRSGSVETPRESL